MPLTPPPPASAKDQDRQTERIEIDLLLEAIYLRYGYDFRDYSRETLERRTRHFLADRRIAQVCDVIGRVLRDPVFFFDLISYFSINVTSFFRDPVVYAGLRERVAPMLRTWPHIKVWDAGCATGEEVHSLAILLHEEGLLDRTTIYATDINQSALDTAKACIYPLGNFRLGGANYLESGGRASFSDYYRADRDAGILDARLRGRATFARHNLAMDASFGEMHVVICRNVLIYFNSTLQDRALELFWDSLEYGGFLCLGDKETTDFTAVADRFELVDGQAKIFKKRVP